MAPKRHRNFDNRPAAKKARDSAFGMNLNAEEIATLLRERTALKLNVSNNGVKVGGFKNNSRQQKSGREIMTRAVASHNSQQELSVLNGVSDKFDSVLKKTNDLCDRMEEAQNLLQNGRNSERTEVETLSLAQKLLVEDFEQKLLEKDEIRRKLQEELEQQDESYLREIDELKAQIEQSNANRIDPNYVTCSICLEPWNSSGSHRVSALACGHVYGDMCIRVHLNSSQECPMCRSPADSKDLRYLFLESHSSAAN